MKFSGNTLIQILINLLLIIGCLYGYWNFSSTMFVFTFEILALMSVGFIYFLLPRSSGQPGLLLFSGALVIIISLLTTWLIAHNIGEVDKFSNGAYAFKSFVIDVSMEIWPIYGLALVGILLNFFLTSKKEMGLPIILFRKIFTLFGVIILSVVVMNFLHAYNHMIIIICLIVAKLLVDLLLNQKSTNNELN